MKDFSALEVTVCWCYLALANFDHVIVATGIWPKCVPATYLLIKYLGALFLDEESSLNLSIFTLIILNPIC